MQAGGDVKKEVESDRRTVIIVTGSIKLLVLNHRDCGCFRSANDGMAMCSKIVRVAATVVGERLIGD